jgi:hypothetical protein
VTLFLTVKVAGFHPLCLCYYPISLEDGDSMFLWNIGIYLRVYTGSKPGTTSLSSSQPWEPQISHNLMLSLSHPHSSNTISLHQLKRLYHIWLEDFGLESNNVRDEYFYRELRNHLRYFKVSKGGSFQASKVCTKYWRKNNTKPKPHSYFGRKYS